MIVVCTDISPIGSIKGHYGLTLNKKYEVLLDDSLPFNDFYFDIIIDYGERCTYRSIRFISLDKFRETKLKELGI